MRWTKRHSRNAVLAKARLRVEQAESEPATEPRRKVSIPRSKVRFTLTFEDHRIGDKLRLSLCELPWRGRFVSMQGEMLSTAQIGLMLATILNHD